jgi:beta-galactosidase
MLLLMLCGVVFAGTYLPQNSNRVTINLDTGWLFNKSDNASFSEGTGFNDATWSSVCLPHSNVISRHMFLDTAAYRIVTWYRRHFTPPAAYANRRFVIEFEAVSVIATVYVNGVAVGTPHKGAYTPFSFDITDKIKPGQDNVIAVKVDSKKHTEIPPEGRPNLDLLIFGGIIRHVIMNVTDPLYVEWTYVSSQNPSQTAPSNPALFVKTQVANRNGTPKNCTVVANVVDAAGNVVASASSTASIPASSSATVNQTTGAISNPLLWSVDRPNLYSVFIQVRDESGFVDEYKCRTGIRSLMLNKTDGKCYLNGEAIKLRGLNRHETYPYIGRAASKRLQRRDADILKYELGCNIVRTSHYPQAPDFFDRCDEIGLLVLEEVPGWQYLGSGEWHDILLQNLVDMVKRDRNHPSLLSWGCRVNESPDNECYKLMNDTARSLDPSRQTHGVRFSNGIDPTYFYEDIWTQNFYVPLSNPRQKPFITTEFAGHSIARQAHSWDVDTILINQITESPRGHGPGQEANYATSVWAGMVGWCAFDYNSQHANATVNDSGRGLMGFVSPHGVSNIFRQPKLAAYFFQSQRDPALYGPMVRILNYWTSSSPTTVLVASNCEEVALYQDGVLIGKKTPNLYTSLPHPCFQWTGVTFKPGELKAIGYIRGEQAATHGVKTPGSPAKLILVPDTSVLYTGGDMTMVIASLLDDYGQVLHLRADSISLSASGAGDFIGEAKTALEGGQMGFFVKTRASQTGAITCQASCSGLSATASITVLKSIDPVSAGPSARQWNPGATAGSASEWYAVYGNRLIIPGTYGKSVAVTVFDCRGRAVYRNKTTAAGVLDLKKLGIARGVHVIRIAGKPAE